MSKIRDLITEICSMLNAAELPAKVFENARKGNADAIDELISSNTDSCQEFNDKMCDLELELLCSNDWTVFTEDKPFDLDPNAFLLLTILFREERGGIRDETVFFEDFCWPGITYSVFTSSLKGAGYPELARILQNEILETEKDETIGEMLVRFFNEEKTE